MYIREILIAFYTQKLKEMDGATSAEIKQASEDISKWHILGQQKNNELSLLELKKKQEDLTIASKHFNAITYLTLGCSLTNTACIIGFFITNRLVFYN